MSICLTKNEHLAQLVQPAGGFIGVEEAENNRVLISNSVIELYLAVLAIVKTQD